jgi:hypothetical protein
MANRGAYRFGTATVKKKYLEVLGTGRNKRASEGRELTTELLGPEL